MSDFGGGFGTALSKPAIWRARLQRYKLRERKLLDPGDNVKLHRCHDNDESNYVDEYENDDDDDDEKTF